MSGHARRLRLAAAAATLALGVMAGISHADAAVITAMSGDGLSGAALSGTPVAIAFGGGAATYDFTAAGTAYGPGAAVATRGTAQIATLGGAVTDFFAGSSIDQTGELYGFSSSPMPGIIPFSAADDFIGLAFTLGDGTHYGYAEVAGPLLVRYGYDSTPGASILTGAAAAAVPEPASVMLLAAGVAGLMVARRRPSRATGSMVL